MRQLHRAAVMAARLPELTRPHVALQGAAYTFLGAYLGAGWPVSNLPRVALAAAVVALVVAYGFVSNDYADRELDRATKPQRPLPAGRFTPRAALAVGAALALASLGLGAGLPPPLFALTCLNLALTTAYAVVLKRTVLLGNIAIALLNSSVVVFGALASGATSTLVLIVAAVSLLYTMGQEVLYTASDREGDAAAGLVTTAVFFGTPFSLGLFRALMLLSILAAVSPLWLVARSPLYLLALILCTIGPVVLYILPLVGGRRDGALVQACEAVKLVRLTSLLPFILLRSLL